MASNEQLALDGHQVTLLWCNWQLTLGDDEDDDQDCKDKMVTMTMTKINLILSRSICNWTKERMISRNFYILVNAKYICSTCLMYLSKLKNVFDFKLIIQLRL